VISGGNKYQTGKGNISQMNVDGFGSPHSFPLFKKMEQLSDSDFGDPLNLH